MTNNDLLRRLRYALNINDKTVMVCFNLGDYELPQEELDSYFKRDEEEGYRSLHDKKFEHFLDGFIIHERGKQKPIEGAPVRKKIKLSNNEILKKLRIALKLKDTDMIDILYSADFRIAKAELGAFFRPIGHKNYQECKDQILRTFIQGLTLRNKK